MSDTNADSASSSSLRRVEIDTTDPAEAGRFVCASGSVASFSAARFQFAAISRSVAGCGVDTWTLGGVGSAKVTRDELCIVQVMSGFCEVKTTRSPAVRPRGQLLLGDSAAPVRVSWEDARVGIVTLDRTLLRAMLRVVAHGSPQRLYRGLVTLPTSRHWLATVRYVAQAVLSDAQIADVPIRIADAARLLTVATALLLVDDPGQDAAVGVLPPASVRRAAEFIDGHAAERISLTDIAAVAGLGARALQEAFRRHLDTTPIDLLRSVRMSRAHDALRGADRRTDRIADIAARCGFAHPGRFTVAYRKIYGCTPRDTLLQ